MSQHPSHPSDRAAAYRGLILGAIAIGVLLVTIVKLTNAHYASAAGEKKASISSPTRGNGALDT
jgi:cell division protein FtsN